MTYHNVDSAYLHLCEQLLAAPRVGNTRELNDVVVQITNVEDAVVSVRNISVEYLFGELLWYFTGRSDLDFISKFSRFWNNISDDGVTCNSAYGYLIFHKHGFDQFEKAVELLRKDSTSRRAVININVPNRDVIETKDEPCTISIQFLLRNDRLNCTVCMRSNDIWFGFTYDVAFFTALQKQAAKLLGVKCGIYTHFVCSMHLYDKDAEKIASIVKHPVEKHIRFDHDRFHRHKHTIADAIAVSSDPKKTLMEKLEAYGIYKEEQ